MKMIRLAGLTLIGAISCIDGVAPQITNLETAKARWQAQDLHTYAFTLQRACFCLNTHPLYVAVVRDTVIGVIDFETGQPADIRFGMTVDGLFTFIRAAIDRPAQKISVEYDAAKGYPKLIDYDGEAQIADDEVTFTASDVHPITPQLPALRK